MIGHEMRERLANKRSIGARHSKFGGAYVLNQNNAFALTEDKQPKMVLHSAWVKTEDALKKRQPKNSRQIAALHHLILTYIHKKNLIGLFRREYAIQQHF